MKLPDLSRLMLVHPDELGRIERYSSPQFAEEWEENIDAFVRLRVAGIRNSAAFLAAFGPQNADENLQYRVHSLNCNPVVLQKMMDVLAEAKPTDLWTLNMAVMNLRDIATDPLEKGPARVSATKELNVLLDITYTDDKGNTQRRGLGDFYGAEGSGKAPNTQQAGV